MKARTIAPHTRVMFTMAVTEELRNFIHEQAKAFGVPAAVLVRHALAEYLDNRLAAKPAEAA
jgi:hypothetical protein